MALVTESMLIGSDTTVMAQIEKSENGKEWLVTVLIDRPANQLPIKPGDVDVQLVGENGLMEVVSRPLDLWVEAGGAAGMTASGVYTFKSGDGLLKMVRINWQGKVGNLRIVV
jgi:hypothetical protein